METKEAEQGLNLLLRELAEKRERFNSLLKKLTAISSEIMEEQRILYSHETLIQQVLEKINPLNKEIVGYDFSVRSYNILLKAEIHTVGILMKKTDEELRSIGLGKKGLKEVRDIITRIQKDFPAEEQVPSFSHESHVPAYEML